LFARILLEESVSETQTGELTLSKENHEVAIAPEPRAGAVTTKKPFVEPQVSGAIDVLEATNFFQGVTGTTDPVVP
jgi:hypothetical protein